MSEIKFACPHCQQHIQADSGYGGMQINCPSCNGGLVVPGTAPAPVSAPPPPPTPGPVTLQRQAATTGASTCPSCGAALGRAAVLCTRCGFNLATGQRTVAGRPAALGKPSSPQYERAWYQGPFPYVGALLVILAVLYFLSRGNPMMWLAFLGVVLLYCLTVNIIVIVAAFRTGVGTGFLTMCVPFYGIYFVYKVHDNDTLKVLYSVAILLNLALRFIKPDL